MEVDTGHVVCIIIDSHSVSFSSLAQVQLMSYPIRLKCHMSVWMLVAKTHSDGKANMHVRVIITEAT